MNLTSSAVIRKATQSDAAAIAAIGREVVQDGSTYAFAPETTEGDLVAYWLSPQGHTYVACIHDEIAGCYIIKANQAGRGAHVANGSYMVAAKFAGHGVGHAMGQHSLDAAREFGFKAMQYNLVVATNVRAVALWKRLGFHIVGTLPQAFHHPSLGYVDAHVMYRLL